MTCLSLNKYLITLDFDESQLGCCDTLVTVARTSGPLKSTELTAAKEHWFAAVQMTEYSEELNALLNGEEIPPRSKLLPLRPFVDVNGILHIVGRYLSLETHAKRHLVFLPGKHPFVVLLIRSEHLRLLHAGPTLVAALLSRQFHMIGNRRVVRSVTCNCAMCKCGDGKSCPQLLGQLPVDRLNPGPFFGMWA